MPSFLLLSSLFFLFLFIPVTISLNFTVNNSNFDQIFIWDHQGSSAYVNHEAIHLTIESTDSEDKEIDQGVGRATYKEKFHLWDKKSNKTADFTTHFQFELHSENKNSYGNGLAFFMAPVCSTIPNDSDGGGLGLVSPSKIGTGYSLHNCESFVAVEFDTYQDEWEISPSLSIPHVGIDINSVISNNTVPWANNVSVEVDNHAWITYNSSTKTLSVKFSGNPGRERDEKHLVFGNLSYEVDLQQYLPEYVIVGFSASREHGFERHKVYNWNFTSTELPEGNGNLKLILGLSFGILSSLVLVSSLVISC